MACGITRRPCANLPTKDTSIPNVSDITFTDTAGGTEVDWTGVGTGTVAIAVVDALSYARADYAMVESPTVTYLSALTVDGVYRFSIRREYAGEASAWAHYEVAFASGATGVAVEMLGEIVTHLGDPVVHTRVDIFLVEDDTSDFIVTESGDNISVE